MFAVEEALLNGELLPKSPKGWHDDASPVHAVATHGLFVGDAGTVLASDELRSIAVTDTVPPFRLSAKLRSSKVTVLDVAPLLAEAIRHLHEGGSIVDLVEAG